jgi:hypothetical protein
MPFSSIIRPGIRRHDELEDVGSDPILGSGNQFGQGTLAERPAPGRAGRLYYVTGDPDAAENDKMYRDTGSEWIAMLEATTSSGFDLEEGRPSLGLAWKNGFVSPGVDEVTVYTCPVGKRAILEGGVHINNPAGIAITWDAWIVPGGGGPGDANELHHATHAIGASTLLITGGVLNAGDSLRVKASAAGLHLAFGIHEVSTASAAHSKIYAPIDVVDTLLHTVPGNRSSQLGNGIAIVGHNWGAASVELTLKAQVNGSAPLVPFYKRTLGADITTNLLSAGLTLGPGARLWAIASAATVNVFGGVTTIAP